MKKILLVGAFLFLAPLAHASTITPTGGSAGTFTFTPTATSGGFVRFYEPSGNTWNPTNPSPQRICTGTNNGVATLTCNLTGINPQAGSVYGTWQYTIFDSGGGGVESGALYDYTLPPPPPPASVMPDPTALMAAVTSAVVTTGADLWPMFSLIGIVIAFWIATWIVTFIRRSTQKKSSGYFYSDKGAPLKRYEDQELGREAYNLQETGMTDMHP